ncbi:MAG: amidophosphoribosyltransferase [Lachnospiraceae bacterium]|nr:amidophosphoribosyltransferase [Lachnospiraceae bacterium]
MFRSYKPHEECGVFGILIKKQVNVARTIYYGLNALQHRGQESAGIAVCDTYGEKGNIGTHKGMGLVSEVFHEDILNTLTGNIGIGHVRYSTTGASNINNAQPFYLKYLKGTLALVHNGNIRNASAIRSRLEMEGAAFQGTSDSEVLAARIVRERMKTGSIEEAVLNVSGELKGGYAVIAMSPRKLVGIRDPLGLKPMCLGKLESGYVLASESAALTAVGAEYVRDIAPGEMITITEYSVTSDMSLAGGDKEKAHCIFEYIYFARLDSKIDGIDVYDARIRGGRSLARRFPADADIVTGVPESGITAAVGYSKESGIPFSLVFHKNSYIGRTFIKPTQEEREIAVAQKLSILGSVVMGKRVVLIDDSIVRGTTIRKLIEMLKSAGATQVHVRISSPPFLYPCYYGTDIPSGKQLIADSFSKEEIREMIGADSLEYMEIEDLHDMVGDLPVCKACFNGVYPD